MRRDVEDEIFELSSLGIENQALIIKNKTVLLLDQTQELLKDSREALSTEGKKALLHENCKP